VTKLVRTFRELTEVYATMRAALLHGPIRVHAESLEDPRTPEQVRKVMAMCADIAEQCPFPGPPGFVADAEAWYRFLIGLMRGEAMARQGQVIVIIGRGLSGATKSEASALIEFITAYGIDHGVRFTEGEGAWSR
jgi:hypothetical protein